MGTRTETGNREPGTGKQKAESKTVTENRIRNQDFEEEMSKNEIGVASHICCIYAVHLQRIASFLPITGL